MTQQPDPRRALFLASFDPVTNGHLDLIHRAHRVFPQLVVAVGTNVSKAGTFDLDARLDMLRTALADLPDVEVMHFDGLLVDLAQQVGRRWCSAGCVRSPTSSTSSRWRS